MKYLKILYLAITILVTLISSSCSKAQRANRNDELTNLGTGGLVGKKILIVYLTRTRNTKAVAEMIRQQVGGKLLALELVTPYPQSYQAHVAQVAKENDEGFLPLLKTRVDSIRTYDVVFIGFPTWGMQMPPPMKSFLKQYDLSGKTVVPFNTNAGYGVGSGFQMVKELCPKSAVLEGFSVRGGIERDGVLFVMDGEKEKQVQADVDIWLKQIFNEIELKVSNQL